MSRAIAGAVARWAANFSSETDVVMMCCNGFDADLYNRAPTFYATRVPDSTLMMELLWLFAQIALLRRGPQDIPASPVLLLVTVFGYAAVNSLMAMLLPATPAPWFLPLIIETLFLLAWCVVLLRVMNRPERFLQTATAMFGYQMVLTPPIAAATWLMQQVDKESAWMLPVVVVVLALLVWLVTAGGRIFKAALEWSMPAGVGLMVAQLLALNLLIAALFAPLS